MVPTGGGTVDPAAEVGGGAGATVVLLLGATEIDGDETVFDGGICGEFADPHAVSTAAAITPRQTRPVRIRFQLVISIPLPHRQQLHVTFPSRAQPATASSTAAPDGFIISPTATAPR